MKKRIIKVLTIFSILCILGIIYVILFEKNIIKVPCLFNLLTGKLCPGCGITRCFISILHGDFIKAYHYNRLVFILLPFATIYFIYWLYNYIIGNKNYYKLNKWTYVFLTFITILFAVIRNIK